MYNISMSVTFSRPGRATRNEPTIVRHEQNSRGIMGTSTGVTGTVPLYPLANLWLFIVLLRNFKPCKKVTMSCMCLLMGMSIPSVDNYCFRAPTFIPSIIHTDLYSCDGLVHRPCRLRIPLNSVHYHHT